MLAAAKLEMPTENTTLDELIEDGKAVSKPDQNIYGINLPYDLTAGMYWIFRSFGADFLA